MSLRCGHFYEAFSDGGKGGVLVWLNVQAGKENDRPDFKFAYKLSQSSFLES